MIVGLEKCSTLADKCRRYVKTVCSWNRGSKAPKDRTNVLIARESRGRILLGVESKECAYERRGLVQVR